MLGIHREMHSSKAQSVFTSPSDPNEISVFTLCFLNGTKSFSTLPGYQYNLVN